MECIIVAGGLGTRLQHIVPDVPKCLAPVNGEPFLDYIMSYLEAQQCDHVILALGYKHEMVLDWLKSKAFTFKVSWVIEHNPLGTGGAVKKAIQKCTEQDVFVLNGDTLFDLPLKTLWDARTTTSKAVLALKPMQNFERYGTVMADAKGTIYKFDEKKPCKTGNINGGVYLLQNVFTLFDALPEAFSLEKDLF
jgi:D-glycero-alpha-D-manno-heptose 1-phosphate guanylyltransferase